MSTNKGKGVAEFSDFDMDQLNQVVQDVNLDPNDEGGWEAPKPTPWGQPDALRPAGRGGAPIRPPTNVWANPASGRRGAINYNPAPNGVPPPLQSGWNWNSRPNNPLSLRRCTGIPQPPSVEEDVDDQSDDDDGSDDELLSDEYDSDESPKSHEERKKHKWYCEFFTTLDKLAVEQINEPMRYILVILNLVHVSTRLLHAGTQTPIVHRIIKGAAGGIGQGYNYRFKTESWIVSRNQWDH